MLSIYSGCYNIKDYFFTFLIRAIHTYIQWRMYIFFPCVSFPLLWLNWFVLRTILITIRFFWSYIWCMSSPGLLIPPGGLLCGMMTGTGRTSGIKRTGLLQSRFIHRWCQQSKSLAFPRCGLFSAGMSAC